MGDAREQCMGMPQEGRIKGDVPPAGLSPRGPLTSPTTGSVATQEMGMETTTPRPYARLQYTE